MLSKKYKENNSNYDPQPDRGLLEVIKLAPKGAVLDLGAGEGRNSIFLAKKGFKVEAIDRAREELAKCKEYAKQYKLPIKTGVVDIRKFNFLKNRYALILGITTLDFLKLSETKQIVSRIKDSLKKDGIFYLAVFSTRDPSFKISKKAGFKIIEKNTFYFPRIKSARHYFQKKELFSILKDFEIIKFEEIYKKYIPKTAHFHNYFRIIAKRK